MDQVGAIKDNVGAIKRRRSSRGTAEQRRAKLDRWQEIATRIRHISKGLEIEIGVLEDGITAWHSHLRKYLYGSESPSDPTKLVQSIATFFNSRRPISGGVETYQELLFSTAPIEAHFPFNVIPSPRVATSAVGRHGETFEYEGLTAEIVVFDLPQNGYSDADIVLAPLPETKMFLKDRFLAEHDPRIRALQAPFEARRAYWAVRAHHSPTVVHDNHDLVGFDRIDLSRNGDARTHSLHIQTSRSSYLDHRAIVDVFKDLTASQRADVWQESPAGSLFFGRLSAIAAVLITDDGFVMFPRRSLLTASDPGMITCGINEGIVAGDTIGTDTTCVPRRAIIRGLYKEASVTLPADLVSRISITSFVYHARYFEWYFFGIVDLRDCGPRFSHQHIWDGMRSGKAEDRWETSRVSWIKLSADDLLGFIRAHRDEMTEYGVAAAIMAARSLGVLS